MTATDGHSWPKSAFSRNYLGSMGCAYSHRNLLREFDTGENTIMVCEDDLEILADPRYFWAVVDDFLRDPRLDVLCLAGNVTDNPLVVSAHLAISQSISTTSCYVVKKSAIALLERNFHQSLGMFFRGESVQVASIDQNWKKLQRRKLIFATPIHRVAAQRKSHSDITGAMEDRGV
jgi:GR25 family glycosyltransferase involved in LPS biosynthesis